VGQKSVAVQLFASLDIKIVLSLEKVGTLS
jgi:hypothetical protein